MTWLLAGIGLVGVVGLVGLVGVASIGPLLDDADLARRRAGNAPGRPPSG